MQITTALDQLGVQPASELHQFFNQHGLMTPQLKAMGQLAVNIQQERDNYLLSQEEARLLSASSSELARLRCTYLCVNQQPFIYGRVVIPHQTLNDIAGLRDLGCRPLGELLSENKAQREPVIYFAKLTQEDKLYSEIIADINTKPATLLLRYSIFVFPSQDKLMVYEVILPALYRCFR